MTRTRTTLWLAALPLAIGGVLACGGAGEPDHVGGDGLSPTFPAAPTTAPKAPAASGKPAVAKPSAASIEDGTWTVGEDIPAGTYRVAATVGSDCYWAITKSGSNGNDIIANDMPGGGRPRVTIKKGQDFETQGCGTWTKVG